MGNRLSAIATRTGDAGETGLGDGSRVGKSSPRVAAMGDVDELNSGLGLLLAIGVREAEGAAELLRAVQQDLFDLGGELSIPGYALLREERVVALDQALQRWNSELPRLSEFILPGGILGAAQAHVCRTTARRAERTVVALAQREAVNATCLQYLNRLSDLLFVLARVLNRHHDEPQWRGASGTS